MDKKYIRFILPGVLLFVFLFPFDLQTAGVAFGSEKTDILSLGEGRIKGNNVADARKEAISDALKKGVMEYLYQYLGLQGMVSNFSILINNIIPDAADKIENYYIVAEEKNGENYSILAQVKINEKLMEQQLKEMGIFRVETNSIKVLFMVSQENISGKEVLFWWNNPEGNPALTTAEIKLNNIFRQQGFLPVDIATNFSIENISEDMKLLDISNEAIMKWGKAFSADVIVKGSCKITANNTIILDLTSINAADGKTICRGSQTEQMNLSESNEDRLMNALEKIINNIAIQFGPEIIKSFKKKEETKNNILITLKNVNNLKEVSVLKKFLEENFSDIKSVIQSRIKGNSMDLSIDYIGIKDAFINKFKSYKGWPFQFTITDGEGGGLVLNIEHELADFKDN